MAERRMFAKSIINSARFLRMSAASRLLYYDLGMDADDDGFVEAFTVMRKTGANEDDLKVLASKGFVRILNEDFVSSIVDWRTNNQIRTDRYHESVYKKLLDGSGNVLLAPDTQVATNGLPNGNQVETEVRLGKDRIGKDRIADADKPPTRRRFGIYENVLLSDEEYAKLKAEFPSDYAQRIERLSEYIASTGKKYKSHLATIRSWARKDGVRQPEQIVLAPLEDPFEAAVREGRYA